LKCDVDVARDIAGKYAVSAMPTFIFLKGTTKVDQVRGADKNALESALRKHAGVSPTSTPFSGKGQTLGGSGGANTSPPSQPKEAQPGVWRLDPQVKVLLGLMGVYVLFWYLS
jgi:thioredoxin 1